MLVESKTHCAQRTVRSVQQGQGEANEEARAMAISPRPPEGPGALENFSMR